MTSQTKDLIDAIEQEIAFISLEELNQKAISLKDMFSSIDDELDPIVATLPESPDTQISPDELLELLPPSAEPSLERQGFSQVKVNAQNPFELHFAAHKGDMKQIIKLVESGYDVNKEDFTSSRPLYVASRYGHLDAVKYFVAKGANVNDDSFDNEFALHVALEHKHYAIARHLVENGANIYLLNNAQNTATNVLINRYMSFLDKTSEEIRNPAVIQEMLEIIKTLDVFSHHCGDHFLYQTAIEGSNHSFDLPVGYFLKNFATRAPTTEVRDKLIALSDDLATFDTSEQTFDHAKNLLNTFPSNNIYLLSFDDHKTVFNGAGHFGHSSTKWASTSISAYCEHLKAQGADKQKLAVFSKLAQIFEAATELKSNGELESYAQKAYERYESGETVLLGTGWKSHFIDVVLSKNHELFITGNSGSRSNQFTPGLNLYHMNDTSAIGPKFMHDMTVNMQKMYFERDIMYEYELVEKVDEKITPLQKFQNCTWVGHQHGIEASLYVELLNLGVEKAKAKTLATQYYSQWEGFHGVFQIEHYMKNNPGLPVQALTDIMKDVSKNVTKENETYKKAQASKLVEALTSDHYRAEFKSWYQSEMKTSHSKEVKKLFEPYHVVEKLNDTTHKTEVAKGEASGGIGGFFKNLFFGEKPAIKNKILQHDASNDTTTTELHTDVQATHADEQTTHAPVQVTHDPLPHFESISLSM